MVAIDESTNPAVSVDGGWGEFSDWSVCSAKCGGGVQSRTRACDNPVPENGGAECQGEEKQERDCNTDSCPGNHISDVYALLCNLVPV